MGCLFFSPWLVGLVAWTSFCIEVIGGKNEGRWMRDVDRRMALRRSWGGWRVELRCLVLDCFHDDLVDGWWMIVIRRVL